MVKQRLRWEPGWETERLFRELPRREAVLRNSGAQEGQWTGTWPLLTQGLLNIQGLQLTPWGKEGVLPFPSLLSCPHSHSPWSHSCWGAETLSQGSVNWDEKDETSLLSPASNWSWAFPAVMNVGSKTRVILVAPVTWSPVEIQMFSYRFAVLIRYQKHRLCLYYFKVILMIWPTAGSCYLMCNEKNKYNHLLLKTIDNYISMQFISFAVPCILFRVFKTLLWRGMSIDLCKLPNGSRV